MSIETEALTAHYQELAEGFQLTETGNYQTLVTPNGNNHEPIHRWFHLKEAYSHRILARIVKDTRLDVQPELRIFDPFVGSGTTAVSAAQLIQEGQLRAAHFRGTETNPFLHLLSSSKLRSLKAPPQYFAEMAGAIASRILAGDRGSRPLPGLSTFNARYFPGDNLEILGSLLELTLEFDLPQGEELTRNLTLLAVAAAIEPASRLRRDGRALREVPQRLTKSPLESFLQTVDLILADLPQRPVEVTGSVELADVRSWSIDENEENSFDLSVFSPPYPNNIDYTEVYKLENWMLGLIADQDQFTLQRRKTVRSHGSLKWAEDYPIADAIGSKVWLNLLDPILNAIPVDRYQRARRQLVLGYANDMGESLLRVQRALRPGGSFACVVGNSLHGHGETKFLLAADLIIAALAERLGLEVERLEVARYPARKRSESPLLRETVIFGRN